MTLEALQIQEIRNKDLRIDLAIGTYLVRVNCLILGNISSPSEFSSEG